MDISRRYLSTGRAYDRIRFRQARGILAGGCVALAGVILGWDRSTGTSAGAFANAMWLLFEGLTMLVYVAGSQEPDSQLARRGSVKGYFSVYIFLSSGMLVLGWLTYRTTASAWNLAALIASLVGEVVLVRLLVTTLTKADAYYANCLTDKPFPQGSDRSHGY